MGAILTRETKTLGLALATYLVWIAITVVRGAMAVEGKATLDQLVSHRIGWQFVAACLFLIASIVFPGWPALGFTRPQPPGVLKLLWLPALFILVFFAGAVVLGLPSPAVIGFLTVNTAMVGFSEEVMFRGILFQALRQVLPIWTAIAASTLLFGAVHALNGFITGDFASALIQSIAAGMSGLLFMAILIRTGSIIPAIAVHALWDFGLFLMASRMDASKASEATGGASWLPVLVVLPNLVYALFLLRRIPANIVTQPQKAGAA